jgi:homoserine kinase type II
MRWAVERAPRDSLADLAWRILDLAQSEAPRHAESIRRAAGQTCRLQACLRDARPDHFLFEGERVTGLIDFGAMDLDTVACDLARLLTEWLGRDRELRAEALDAYGSVRVLDTTEIALIDAFETSSALLAAAHWVRWHFVEGRVFEDGEAVVRGLTRGLERLAHLSAYGSP